MGIRPGPGKAGLSTDSLQQVGPGRKLPAPAGRRRARRQAGTSRGGSTQARTTQQSEPVPSLAQRSALFSLEELPALSLWFRGRNSGSRWVLGAGAGSPGSLGSAPASGDRHSHPRGVRWHHLCVSCLPLPRKPANQRDFLPVTLSPSFCGHQMAVWLHERNPPPPFVLGKKKERTKTKLRDVSCTICHVFLWACLSPAAPPFRGFLSQNLLSRFLSHLVFLLLGMLLPVAFRKSLWALIHLFFSDPGHRSSPERIGKTHTIT